MTSGFNRKRLRYSPRLEVWGRYLTDCKRIQEALLREHHFIVSVEEAHHMWHKYSKSQASMWMDLPETHKEIAEILIE